MPQHSGVLTEDLNLIQKALSGEQDAYAALQKKYSPLIRRVIRRMVKDRELEEDLVQDIFIKIFEALPRFAPTHSFAAWIYRIASNHCIDVLRKKQLSFRSLEQFYRRQGEKEGEGEEEFHIPDTSFQPEMQLRRKELRELLDRAIAQLPEHYRQVIVLRHIHELEYQEISERLQLPLGTVKAQLFRARALLYQKLRTVIGEWL